MLHIVCHVADPLIMDHSIICYSRIVPLMIVGWDVEIPVTRALKQAEPGGGVYLRMYVCMYCYILLGKIKRPVAGGCAYIVLSKKSSLLPT